MHAANELGLLKAEQEFLKTENDKLVQEVAARDRDAG